MRVSDFPDVDKLSIPEKVELIDMLWDQVTADPSALPVPESHKAELDRRLEEMNSNPDAVLSFEELKERIDRRM